MQRYDLRSSCGCQTELDPWSDGDWVRHDEAQAEIARLTTELAEMTEAKDIHAIARARLAVENETLRWIERNLQDAWEHEHQRAERALAELARLREQMKDREYD